MRSSCGSVWLPSSRKRKARQMQQLLSAPAELVASVFGCLLLNHTPADALGRLQTMDKAMQPDGLPVAAMDAVLMQCAERAGSAEQPVLEIDFNNDKIMRCLVTLLPGFALRHHERVSHWRLLPLRVYPSYTREAGSRLGGPKRDAVRALWAHWPK